MSRRSCPAHAVGLTMSEDNAGTAAHFAHVKVGDIERAADGMGADEMTARIGCKRDDIREHVEMKFGEEQYNATINLTRHGKPSLISYTLPSDIGESYEEHIMNDALGISGGVEELAQQIRDQYPGIDVRYAFRIDLPLRNESGGDPVGRERFGEIWELKVKYDKDLIAYIDHDFLRNLPIILQGKDRVQWWSGWFHYPILIAGCEREAKESLTRLKVQIQETGPEPDHHQLRDIIEEAYYEQVQRQRLAIYERRRETWRVIRWGSTTALGLVLAFWSGLQIWDWFFR